MTVVLIKPSTAAPEDETAFLELWKAAAATFRWAPGYRDAVPNRAWDAQPRAWRRPFSM